LYRKNKLTGFSPLREVESLALPGESYKLAFTPSLLHTIYVDSGKIAAGDVDHVFGVDGGYVHSGGDLNWWISSGQIFYSLDSADTPAKELSEAAHFSCHDICDLRANAFVDFDANNLPGGPRRTGQSRHCE
jgi:hypothetical protein